MATITDASSKYKDFILKSALIEPGPPSVYQLKPKTENIGTLKRMTIGEKDPNKINKTILLVGETGAGKSTLINALVNYAMGVTWEDKMWFQIVEDEKRSQSESQTTDVMVYEIFGFEGQTLPYSLTIIDTPGYGSTTGSEHDDIIAERLCDLFRAEAGVHEINAVGLVLKASENRLSDRLRYILYSIMSLFGKNVEKNIVALITHSNGRKPKNALKALKDADIRARIENDQPVHFLFDNCQNEDRTDEAEELKHSFQTTMTGMSQFTEFLQKTAPQPLITTVTVLNERIRLKACIQNLKERIEFIELKQMEITQTQEGLKKYEQEMKNNENFTVEVDEVYKEKVDISESRWWALWLNYGGAVCCEVCQENCHHPCTLAWYAERCEVMKDGRCTSCTRKCPVRVHVKEKKMYVSKTRKVKKTKTEMKEKYEKNKAESESNLSHLQSLQKEVEDLQKDKDQRLEESFQHVIRLEQMALKADSLYTYVHLDFLTEKMKEKGDKEKVKRLEEMKRRVDEDKGIRAAVQYMFGKVASVAAKFPFVSQSSKWFFIYMTNNSCQTHWSFLKMFQLWTERSLEGWWSERDCDPTTE